LYNLQHQLTFEDVEGVVSIKFPDFNHIACGSSSDPGIMTVCSNIDYFQAAGIFYMVLVAILLPMILLSILNLLMLIFIQNNLFTQIHQPHMINCALFITAAAGYLLVSNVDNLEPPER
jgi:hypothetical protein